MTADRNTDLVGYEMTDSTGDPPAIWKVVSTDPVLGSNYVLLAKVGSAYRRCQTASSVRRRKEIEAGK